MDTLIFGLLLAAAWITVRGGKRRTVLWLYAAAMVATMLLFKHHVTDKLPLEF